MPKGATRAERDAARVTLRRARRERFFVKRMAEARNGRAQLQQSCYFAQAVGDEMDDMGRRRLAAALARVVEEAQRDYCQ